MGRFRVGRRVRSPASRCHTLARLPVRRRERDRELCRNTVSGSADRKGQDDRQKGGLSADLPLVGLPMSSGFMKIRYICTRWEAGFQNQPGREMHVHARTVPPYCTCHCTRYSAKSGRHYFPPASVTVNICLQYTMLCHVQYQLSYPCMGTLYTEHVQVQYTHSMTVRAPRLDQWTLRTGCIAWPMYSGVQCYYELLCGGTVEPGLYLTWIWGPQRLNRCGYSSLSVIQWEIGYFPTMTVCQTRVTSPGPRHCCRSTACQTRVFRRLCTTYSPLLRLSLHCASVLVVIF